MKFEWDPDKARANVARHGVEFADAQKAFEDLEALEALDEFSPDEERWRLLGRADGKMLMVVYVERGDRIRIISARKATKLEEKAYLEQAS